MSITNDFLAFATGIGANVESQAAYAADANLPLGNQPGIASSAFNNKALRQANYIASQIAQYIGNSSQTNMQDNATPAQLLAQMFSVFSFKAPVITSHLSGTGTHNLSYRFQVASANATSGATYTNNGVTFTVSTTISGGLELIATGSGAPTTSGTLTKASGTGDATITFYAVRAPLYIKIKMVGGGGGGSGSGTPAGTAAGNGGDTTFGTSLLVAGGGIGATGNPGTGSGGASGGTASLGSGPFGLAIPGSAGNGNASATAAGGNGGTSAFGGSGKGGGQGSSAAGLAGSTNSGSGGGGGAGGSGLPSGNGGGSGGFVDATIVNPLSTYAFAVGAAGSAGAAGSSGFVGGPGAVGGILIEEHYQ